MASTCRAFPDRRVLAGGGSLRDVEDVLETLAQYQTRADLVVSGLVSGGAMALTAVWGHCSIRATSRPRTSGALLRLAESESQGFWKVPETSGRFARLPHSPLEEAGAKGCNGHTTHDFGQETRRSGP